MLREIPVIKYFLPESNEDLKNLPYDLRYAKIGIQNIIKNLDQIEQGIIDDLVLTCINFLERNGSKVQGDIFTIKDQKYKLHIEFLKGGRKLLIIFLPIIKPKYASLTVKQEINGFGKIKEFEINYPYAIRKNFLRLVELLREQTIFAYLCLQKVFKSSFRSLGEYLFNQLYDILNIEIERQNKNALKGRAYFNVTLRSSKKFRYFFDNENLELVIDYFKANQSMEYSPMELITSLIADEAFDTLNMLIDVQEGDFDHIKSSDFISQESDIKFWVSESLLVNYKDLTSFTISKNEKLIFQISCPKEIEAEFKFIFESCSYSLSEKFKENIKNYMNNVHELTKIPKPELSTIYRIKVAEWLGAFTGSAFYTFIKKASKI